MSALPLFSHIYVEHAARRHPLTDTVLARFSKAEVIEINNYKEVFNRPRQRWDHQRRALKLILAERKDSFIYPGSSFVPSFDHARFFYTTPILNCLYGCEYCYLQGMFPSPNMVVFVNTESFIEGAAREIGSSPAYLCVSYDTDLLAVEDLFGYTAAWIDFAHKHPHVTVEIRTKSANMRAIAHLSPPPNVILAWTLSPDAVAARYEHKTPSLTARLTSVHDAQELGWRVRLCLDPVLRVEGWMDHYASLVDETFARVAPTKVCDVSVGVFRINGSYLRDMQERSPASKLVTYPYTVENGSASYTASEREEMVLFIADKLKAFVSEEKICPVPWQ